MKDIVQAQNLLKLLSDWVLQNVLAQCQPFPELFPQGMAALQMRNHSGKFFDHGPFIA
ncbi:hypothetical protein [Pseudovibrio sp. SCP19]|uniref:hypothetical protein n=1 Tax=Pseudovibrio sp. SCP19 TaxID=3141374 RepID=UPI00333CED8B